MQTALRCIYSCKFGILVAYENACMRRYEANESKHADWAQSLPGRGECDLDYPVSLFIMDVANSSRAEAPDGLADYLDEAIDPDREAVLHFDRGNPRSSRSKEDLDDIAKIA